MRLWSGSGEQVKRNHPRASRAARYNPASEAFSSSKTLQIHRDRRPAMKFSDKFELLESLTTGSIETFAANDKVRGERVLVHIVECAPQKPEQSISEWVLASFRRLAPEPAGPVLETGKYSGALYAYLVTKPTDEAAVNSWVRRYELQSEETKETRVHPLKPEISAPRPIPGVPPAVATTEPQPAPGQMTQLFRDYDSLAKAKSPSASESQPPARPLNVGQESGLHSAAPWDPTNVKPAAPAKGRVPESFSVPAKPVAPEFPPPPVTEGPKPGEFTSFFQGPFRGDAPAEVPAFSSEPIEPPRKSVGEFTAMFGQASSQPAEGSSGGKASSTGFTGLFRDLEKPQQTFNSPAPAPGGMIPQPVEPLPIPASPKDPSLTPQAPIFVAPLPPVATTPPPILHPTPAPVEAPMSARPGSLPGDGATGVFNHPSAEPGPAPVQVPSGPSPYTQIISRQKFAAEQSAEAEAHAAAPPSAGGGFAPPPLPRIPMAAPPPIPRIPPPPPIPPAPMPKMSAPKPPAAPKAPKLDAAPPPPVSYWPLIITLTVLFFLAALLVLYFVLKH